MVERLALPFADPLAGAMAGGEHQSGAGAGMGGEAGEQCALVVGGEMEDTVPGDQAVEAAAEIERAHVGDQPLLLREALPAQGDQRGGAIDAGHGEAALDQVAGDRLARAAAQVEDGRADRQQRRETVEPRGLEPHFSSAHPVPGIRMRFIEIDDPLAHARLRASPR